MRETADPAARSRALRSVRKYAMPFVGLAFLLVIGSAWAAGAFTDGRGCTSPCHSMRPYAASHAKSDHAGVSCAECHREPGAAGALGLGHALQRMALAQAGGARAHATAVSDASCRRCHAGTMVGTARSRGIAVRHSDFSATACTLCHGGTGHALAAREYPLPEMDDCMQCHAASAQEPAGCNRCHMPDTDRVRREGATTWQLTHNANWRETHGMGDLGTCVSCHQPAYCARCHGVAVPHPSTWSISHGRAAREGGDVNCTQCHEPSWCSGCHGLGMPHASSFLRDHARAVTEVGRATCLRCHPAETCANCHRRAAHPQAPGVNRKHQGVDAQ